MATNMLGTLLEAALFLEEADKLSSSQSDVSSSSVTSSAASSSSSPTILHRASLPLSDNRYTISSTTSPVNGSATTSWSVKMSTGSSPVVMSVPDGDLSIRAPVNVTTGQVVSTNQSQHPTAKAVSLSVANLPQQTAAIPLVIGQSQNIEVSGEAGSNLGLGTPIKYSQQQHSPVLMSVPCTTGLTMTTCGPPPPATHIIHNSSGHIIHLPSGTTTAVSSGTGAATFSRRMVRVNGKGGEILTREEQFDNDTLPPSLVVISPQNFNATSVAGQPVAVGSTYQHYGPTISIIPTSISASGSREDRASRDDTTGLDLRHVELAVNRNESHISAILSSKQSSPSNTFESNLRSTSQSLFVNRNAYPGLDMVSTSVPTKDENVLNPPSSTVESIMKSTNFGPNKAQALLVNGLFGAPGGSALQFQPTMPTLVDKPEDLTSHLTFNISTSNGYPATIGTVNNIVGKTTDSPMVGVGLSPKPIMNLGDLGADPKPLQDLPQQPLYQMVYQKGGVPPASATSTGRRRTTSNNSTGGSLRSPLRSGTRESHNKLEKNRRAQMRMCFDQLKKQLPKGQEEKKTSNLSILSSALNYIMTLKRTDKEGEHEQERLVKEMIDLQTKLANLKREMASQLDKDPALAALLVSGDIQWSVRTSESGADDISSMDGYETDSFRGGSAVDRSLSPRNMSPLVVSGPVNENQMQMLGGDQVSFEIKSTEANPIPLLNSSGVGPNVSTTILALPNLSQVATTMSPLPLTAINLSSTTNQNNHVPKNGVLIPSSQQIISSASSPFVHTISNGHVLMKGGPKNGFNTANGLIIRETSISPAAINDKMIKLGNGDMLEPPPAKILKLVNSSGIGVNTSINSHLLSSIGTDLTSSSGPQLQPSHTIFTSAQNGGLRVISHHPTVTSNSSNGSFPTSVVFSDPMSKFQPQLPSGMVLPTTLSHQYLSNTGLSGAGTANGTQVHKLLLTGMPPNIMTQGVSGAYSLSQMTPDIFGRGCTSLPGGAQLNICRSPSSTPSPTILSSGMAMQKGVASVSQASGGLPLVSSSLGVSQVVSKVLGSTSQINIKPTQAGPKNKRSTKRKMGPTTAARPAVPVLITSSQTSLEPLKSNPPPLMGKSLETVPLRTNVRQ